MLFDSSFFAGNRQALLNKLPASLIVLTAHSELQKSLDIPFPFEQENNFWYLTGIDEPNWRLVIDGKSQKTYLVLPGNKEHRALWDGALSEEEALKVSGVEEIISKDELDSLLKKLQNQHRRVLTILPQSDLKQYYDFLLNPAPQLLQRELKGLFKEVADCRREISQLRAIKQPQEIKAMQKAIDISVTGIKRALNRLHDYKYEYEFEAELTKFFHLDNGEGHAYDPIVAVGKNACTIHHRKSNSRLSKKAWLLFDVGARYERYCADITRSIPIGEPTPRECGVYEAVQRVHDQSVSLLTPGRSIKEYHEAVDEMMGKELIDLGLIKEPDYDSVRKYFPHAISHGLGIDVHDPLGRPDTFQEGMVLTVEPGIYIPEESLGIRLENDIHITSSGPVNMSGRLPSDIAGLARLVSKSR